jgi:hypothetical protein
MNCVNFDLLERAAPRYTVLPVRFKRLPELEVRAMFTAVI